MRSLLLALALAACTPTAAPVDAGVDDAPALDAAPCTTLPGDLPGPRAIDGLLPPLVFAGEGGPVALADFHAPCAEPDVLVLRVLASWSARSRWHVAHTARLTAAGFTVIDLLEEGPDAEPARTADLEAFAALYDAPPDALAIDPDHQLAELAFGGERLPLVAIVDRRDLRLLRALFAPVDGEIEASAAFARARIRGEALPPPFTPTLRFDRFAEDEWAMLEDVVLAGPLAAPSDPSNAVADVAAAASLGASLFEDLGLSPSGVGCASCHDDALAFTDGLPRAVGVAEVRRNTPTLLGVAHTRWPFWDGRVDSLWAQALGPIENADEMGSSRLFVAHRVASAHAAAYEAAFGPLPDLSDAARFPADGAPGDPAWDAMAAADREIVTRIFVDVGKAIAAFERSLSPAPSAFDRFVMGDETALSPLELDGLDRFVDFGCLDCHHGPRFSDDAFHAIRMPGAAEGAMLDRGRAEAEAALESSAFRRTGAYSDDASAIDPMPTFSPSSVGAFRTPTLRALPSTAPYGHAGTFATIREVVVHYSELGMTGLPPDPRVAGALDRHVGLFDAIPENIDPLTAFLETL